MVRKIVGVRGVKDSTVLLRSSKIGYDLSRIAANIATVSVRISTIPLKIFKVVKNEFFSRKCLLFFLIFAQNIDCGYTLESASPRRF